MNCPPYFVGYDGDYYEGVREALDDIKNFIETHRAYEMSKFLKLEDSVINIENIDSIVNIIEDDKYVISYALSGSSFKSIFDSEEKRDKVYKEIVSLLDTFNITTTDEEK